MTMNQNLIWIFTSSKAGGEIHQMWVNTHGTRLLMTVSAQRCWRRRGWGVCGRWRRSRRLVRHHHVDVLHQLRAVRVQRDVRAGAGPVVRGRHERLREKARRGRGGCQGSAVTSLLLHHLLVCQDVLGMSLKERKPKLKSIWFFY